MPAVPKSDRILAELVRLLAKRRVELGLSKNVLSQRAGLSIAAVRFIEDGKRKPALDTLLRIADGLEVNLWEMLRDATSEK